ncbi:MAG: hypothetical protein Q7R53_01820 [bacterium]|nr:hypothetical protein [bacterium]
MGNNLKEAILKTIIYADIFDYPLTKDEIWRFLICEDGQKIKKKEFKDKFKNLSSAVVFKDEFYSLSKRENLIDKRQRREKESKNKLCLAEKIISYLSCLPTIYLIGISGALSMMNSEKDDDIDLFVITKKNTLWITRLFLVLFLALLKRRRKRGDKDVRDKICLNFLIDENVLSLPKKMQNLYGAHEVAQMRPVFERNNTYEKFINNNLWVNLFLPNVFEHEAKLKDGQNSKSFFNTVLCLFLSCFMLEAVARKLQFWHMKKHITKEIIENHFLAFHPKDYEGLVLKKYKKGLKFILK